MEYTALYFMHMRLETFFKLPDVVLLTRTDHGNLDTVFYLY